MLGKSIEEYGRQPAGEQHLCHILEKIEQALGAIFLLQIFGRGNLVEFKLDLLHRERNRLLDDERRKHEGRKDRKQGDHLDQCTNQPGLCRAAAIIKYVGRIAVSMIHQRGELVEHRARHHCAEHDGCDDDTGEQGERVGFLGALFMKPSEML